MGLTRRAFVLGFLLIFFCLSKVIAEAQMNIINEIQINSWNINACSWDQIMGDDGSIFQLEIVDQALCKLLPCIDRRLILEIACGNGFLSRRFAKEGAFVYALDSSAKFIEIAKERTSSELSNRIRYIIGDATNANTYNQIDQKFDVVICNMAFMDISDLISVFQGVKKLLKPEGMFIVTQTHPCFEKAVGPLFHEIDEEDGLMIHKVGVKVSNYLEPRSFNVKAVPTLNSDHMFFHRSLSHIFNIAFKEGFIINGFEEVAFSKNSTFSEHKGWHLLQDIPVVAGIRFKIDVPN